MLMFLQSYKPVELLKTEIAFEAAPYQRLRNKFQREVSAADLALHRGCSLAGLSRSPSAEKAPILRKTTGVHWITYGCLALTAGFILAGLGNLFLS